MTTAIRWIEFQAGNFFETLGQLLLLFLATLRDLPSLVSRRSIWRTLVQMKIFGWQSLGITIVIALFTGFVVALQTGRELMNFGITESIGSIVGISLAREMGPVITGFLVAGRVGAAMAAELGTMVVTDEVEAMRSMGISPVKFLVVPRVVAGFIMMPLLVAYALWFGFEGGAIVAESLLNISREVYYFRLNRGLIIEDLIEGMTKSFAFGGIVALVSCHFGLAAHGGAESVGRAASKAVVVSLTLILISDFFLARFLQQWLRGGWA